MNLQSSDKYQKALEQRFAAVSAWLASVVPAARIEHIGSSAIPGALSKGDLDVCLIVEACKLEDVVLKLKSFGYVEQTETLRTAELCMLIDSRPSHEHAVQVVARGSQFMFFVEFRDRLRANPQWAEQYNQVKRDAAELGEQRYRAAKARFIESVLQPDAQDV